MNGRSSSARWWFVQGLTVLALGAVFAVYFLVYLPTRTAHLTERNFRLLGDMSEQIADTLATLHTTLTNAAYGALASTNASLTFSNSVRQLKLSMVEPFTNETFGSEFRVIQGVTRQATSYRLDCTYQDARASNGPTLFQVSADFGDLLRPILIRHDFADLLLVNTDGEVIFQLDQAEQRITNLVSSSDLRITRLPDFDEKSPTNRLTQATGFVHVPILDKEYKLFSQPIAFSLNTGEGEPSTKWFLVGLVPAQHFSAQSWELPSTVIILFIFAALVGLLSWPFLNVAFSSPAEESSRLGVTTVLIAAFFGCAALTWLLVDNNVYPSLEDELDTCLNLLATNVEQNLNTELSDARAQLIALNDRLVAEGNEVGNDAQRLASVRKKPRMLTKEAIFSDSSPYPYLTLANWLNSTGYQVFKWTTLSYVTRSMPVADRDYFRSFQEGWAWPWNPVQMPDDTNLFFLDAIFSRARGENVAVLSIPFTHKWPPQSLLGDSSNTTAVACMEFRPLSLGQPVLPRGYGFCLIEPSGKVLFHSDERRNLRENFIKETSRKPRLRAAVHSRTIDDFDLAYMNRGYHVRVAPLTKLPWTLITFRDKQMLRCVHQDLLCSTALLFTFYLAVLGLAVLLIALPRHARRALTGHSREWLDWIWPHRSRRESWAYALIALTGALVSLFGILNSSSGIAVLAWGIAVPWIFIALTYMWRLLPIRRRGQIQKLVILAVRRIRKGADDDTQSVSSEYSRTFRAHMTAMGATFLLVAMLPALACYKAAFLKETGLFVKGTQLELMRHLDQRISRSRAADQSLAGKIARSRLTHPGSYYFSNFFATHRTNAVLPAVRNAESKWFDRVYAASRVYFNEPILKNGGLLPSHAADDSWVTWRKDTAMFFQLGGTNVICSAVPSMRWPKIDGESESIWLLWYVALCVVASAPFLISTFIARRILIFALPRRVREKAREKLPIPELSKVVAGAAAEEWWSKLEQNHIRSIDLDSPKGLGWIKLEPWKRLEPGAVMALANLDQNLEEEELNTRKREALAHLKGEHDKTVVKIPPELVGKPGEIADRLCAWHESAWIDLTPREQITLHQIARNGFASGLRPELQTLFAAKLLRCDPELRLRNESFRRYVLAHFKKDTAKDAAIVDEDTAATRWRAIRSALGIALAVCALFLFITQREFWQLAIGLTSSFAAGFGEFSKITEVFRKSKGQAAKSG